MIIARSNTPLCHWLAVHAPETRNRTKFSHPAYIVCKKQIPARRGALGSFMTCRATDETVCNVRITLLAQPAIPPASYGGWFLPPMTPKQTRATSDSDILLYIAAFRTDDVDYDYCNALHRHVLYLPFLEEGNHTASLDYFLGARFF
jgi:hypothetical protein